MNKKMKIFWYLVKIFKKMKIEKIYPNLFNYFLYSIIDWKLFIENNKLESLKIFELISLLKKSNYDFSMYKLILIQ